MADPVILVDYDPTWPARYETERGRLLHACGQALRSIEHIGSTAVPGLAAKPVIDILVGVGSGVLLDTSAEVEAVPGEHTPLVPAGNASHIELVEAIIGCDFTYRGVNGLPGRLYFFRHAEGRGAHVHVVRQDSWFWHDQLLFRDWLRNHSAGAEDYAKLKRTLALEYRDDRVKYTFAKGGFIGQVLRDAGGQGPWLSERPG